MTVIRASDISFQYRENKKSIENINFSIEPGKITAILGKNGSGKTTIIRLILALLPLNEGKIYINNVDLQSKDGIKYIRKQCGIVFQNPDNQFVSPILEDDIKFGLSNHCIPESLHSDCVKSALDKVNLSGFEKRKISTLSGGQKQRAAAAGILAIDNNILFFDEAGSMLDPNGKAELRKLIEELRNQNKTIVLVSQNIDDVITADRIILISDHRIICSGSAREVLTDYEKLTEAGIQIPFAVRVYKDLLQKGIKLKKCPLTIDELAEEIWNLN